MEQRAIRITIAALAGVGLLLLIAIGVLSLRTPLTAPTPSTLHTVTMDAGGEADPINLWDTYQTRGAVTGRAHSGEQVTLLQQSGDGCEVQTDAGQRGWVTCANFIKEFR